MPIHLDTRKNGLHFAFRVDDVRGSDDSHTLLAVQIFLLPGSVSLKRFVVRIAGKREIQFIFVAELCQLFGRVGAHPHNFSAKLVQLLFGITKLVSFAGSAWRVGLGEEIEDQRLALKIT